MSIIIVGYNCKDFLSAALHSIDIFVDVSKEVIVVDNASTDGTVNELSKLFPAVKFIANDYNAGFSAANNQGFHVSQGEAVLFLNPDAKLLDDHLKLALAELEREKRLIIGPKILNPDGSLQESVIEIPRAAEIVKEALFLGYFFSAKNESVLNRNNYALSGACLLMSRETYSALHGFDEKLFWMDDVDLCYRARAMGAKLDYFQEWVIEHTIGVSSRKNYNSVIANQLISKLKFFKKNNLKTDFFISCLFVQIHIFLRILLFFVLFPFKKVFRQKFIAYLYAQSAFWRYIFMRENRLF